MLIAKAWPRAAQSWAGRTADVNLLSNSKVVLSVVRTWCEHVEREQGETCWMGRVWAEEEEEKARTEQSVGGRV